MKRATYYNILGLNPGASKDEIRSSFRQLALRYHPDRNAANRNAHAAFIAIHNAYKVLINETTRKEYDAYLANTTARTGASQRYSRTLDPRVHGILSIFNSTLWDLEDLLKKIDNENMSRVVGRITLYEYVLNLLGYLESSLLNESDRFSNFSAKQCKSKLHIENYFYLLRMEVDRHLRKLYEDTSGSLGGLRRIVSVETELIKCIGVIRKHI